MTRIHRTGLVLAACLVMRAALADVSPEVIAFAGLEPGGKVADFLPVTPDFTKLFCNAVGSTGHVYVVVVPGATVSAPDESCTNASTQVLRSRNYPAPELHSDSDDPGWVYEYWSSRLPVESFVVPEPLDMIWISDRYHALHNQDFGSANLRFVGTALLTALKPGGILVIVDAVAKDGSGVRDTRTLHRIEPAQVRREMIAAGFEFVGQSHLLHRAADPHTADAYRLRGTADRFLLKFRRPLE